MTRFTVVAAMAMVVVLGGHGSALAVEAEAKILRGITVDGDLSEWPDDLHRYPIRNKPAAYYGATVDSEQDLDAHFMVGYDPDTDEVHVGVVVRDDVLATSSMYSRTDACEIYLHPGTKYGGGGQVQQMVLVPGPGSYGGQALGQAAFRRVGDQTVYEWSVQVRRAGSSEIADLRPGDELGFDVVVVDMDEGGAAAWVPWGSMRTGKIGGLERIARLRLTDVEADGSIFAGLSAVLGALATGLGQGLAVLLVLVGGFIGGVVAVKVRVGNRVERRLAEVERRLGDMQEVVLSVGDELERLTKS